MSAKASTDGVPPVTTSGDNFSDNVGQSGSTNKTLFDLSDYSSGLRDYLRGVQSLQDSANRFLPTTAFARESPALLAQAGDLSNQKIKSDALPGVLGTSERPSEKDQSTAPAKVDPIQEKIKEIQKNYNVTITPPGQFLGNQENHCAAPGRDKPAPDPKAASAIRSRIPTMNELEQLDKALQATGESALTRDGSPLKITFTDKSQERSGNRGGEKALYLQPGDNNGVAELRITPVPKMFENLLPHILRHEIGHNAENNAYTNGQHPDEVIDKIGFKRVPNISYSGTPGELSQLEAIKVNSNGKEMLFIKIPPDCHNPNGFWVRVNDQGQFLSQRGNVVPFRDGQPDPRSKIIPFGVSNDFIKDSLAVKGPTKYFDNSNEAITDAFATWTGLKGEARTAWEQRYPDHFNAIKAMLDAQKRNLGR